MTEATEASAQQGLTDQVSAKAQDAAATVQEKASELREEGSTRLREQFDRRSNEAGSRVRSLAEALRRSSTDLSSEGNTSGARLAEQTADSVERVGSYLEQKNGDELMRDFETFARRRPWMLAGLGMIAGVAAARFIKASSEQRYNRTAATPGARYGSGEARAGGYGTGRGVVGSNAPSALSGDSQAQDRYAGTR